MKYSTLNIIFFAYKYHELCLKVYKQYPNYKNIRHLFSVDFLLNRLVLYFLDTIMLYIENEEQMAMVKQCFSFNWTATYFFTKINNEFRLDNDSNRLNCNDSFYKTTKHTF